MRERPIIMGAESVKAILDWRKTQTRRVIKVPATYGGWRLSANDDGTAGLDGQGMTTWLECPYGKPGDRLWVRETWGVRLGAWCGEIVFRADGFSRALEWNEATSLSLNTLKKISDDAMHWKPSIHMPRWASRITLEVLSERAEQLQDISNEDIIAEGMDYILVDSGGVTPQGIQIDIPDYITPFMERWDAINGNKPGCSWNDDPLVWVVEFKRLEDN